METPVVFLGYKGDIRQSKLKGTISAESLCAVFKKKEAPQGIGKYQWKGKTLFLFGYMDGKPNMENQHHLPPPLEGITFYGDILVVLSLIHTSYANIIPFKTSDYEAFYTNKLEGDDEEEEEEEDQVQTNEETETAEEVADDEEAQEVLEDSSSDTSSEEYTSDKEEEEEKVVVLKPTRVKKATAPPETVITDENHKEMNIHRQKVLDCITELFSNQYTLSETECKELEYNILLSALENADRYEIRKSWSQQGFRSLYFAISRRVVGNLHPSSYIKNKNLWNRYKEGDISFERLCRQNYYEMYPEKWQEMVDRQAKRERIQLEGDFSRATDKYFCTGCKERKCTYYELQTRSADEPMTVFIQCLNCGKRWTH